MMTTRYILNYQTKDLQVFFALIVISGIALTWVTQIKLKDFKYELVILRQLTYVKDDNLSPLHLFNGVVPKQSSDLFNSKSYDYSGPNLKKILLLSKNFFGEGRTPFLNSDCRINTCFVTTNVDLFQSHELDAVLWNFNSRDRSSLPTERSRHTRYIFYSREPASSYKVGDNLSQYNGVFNWTMHFRRDADIYDPYGYVLYDSSIKKNRFNLNYSEGIDYAAGKTKSVAWFVSKCKSPSHREKYVEQLQKYINVDIYGACGEFNCTSSDTKDEKCYEMLEKDYRFYLSFENALCEDYVTSNLFLPLRYNIIPIVYGSSKYNKSAAPRSYIDVMDYDGPKALAQYLIYLEENNDKYNEYFKWKKHHVIIKGWPAKTIAMCKLCEKLHLDNNEKVYKNIKQWHTQSQCMKDWRIKEMMQKW